jgi:YHS domain-containing protein
MSIRSTTILLFLAIVPVLVFGQGENASRRRNFNTENLIALRQFDAVSYFKGKPVKGNEKLEYDYNGITYYFSSEQNLEEFKKTPSKYEPMYGGWCAYTVATTGERVKIDPTCYKIQDGKLFVFYNFSNDNRLTKWNSHKNKAQLKLTADKNWAKKMH